MTEKPPSNRRAILSWCLFDFANSAFTTLIVTFVYATYFTDCIADDQMSGTALWSRGISLTAIIVAVLSPLAGAIADRGGMRRIFLMGSTFICILGCVALFTVTPGQVVLALVFFVIANVFFEMGLVFYNAYLPELAERDKIGRISGYGWSLGYVGGLICLVVALVGFIQPETPWFGFTRDLDQNVRATNLLVAFWFLIFAVPQFLWVHDKKREQKSGDVRVWAAFAELRSTFGQVRRYRQIVRLLLARLIYNDGLITVFAFGGIYAQAEFDFSRNDILVFGIVLNVAAGAGAFGLGFVDDRIGGKRTILISLIGLMIAVGLAVVAPSSTIFWVAGILVGIFSGPNQAASRSLLGRFVPKDKETEFFGFFAFSGKATAFLGPLLLGILTEATGSHRAGFSVVILFLLVGGALLLIVDEKHGIESAESNTHEPRKR